MPGGRRSRGSRVIVTISGQSFRLRTRPASDWISGSLSDDMSGLFPGLVRDADIDRLLDLWDELPDMQVRCLRVSRAALGRASGRDWYRALNLIRECAGSWPTVNGRLVREGVRASEEALDDWLDAAYTTICEGLNKEDLDAFQARLEMVPRDSLDTFTPRMSSREDLLTFMRV